MSKLQNLIEENKEAQDNDVHNEELQRGAMTSQENKAKTDINSWRKRHSIAFHRNPSRLRRRMSQGKSMKEVYYRYYLSLFYPYRIRFCCLLR
jgi:hypothetical protein